MQNRVKEKAGGHLRMSTFFRDIREKQEQHLYAIRTKHKRVFSHAWFLSHRGIGRASDQRGSAIFLIMLLDGKINGTRLASSY